MRLKPNYFIIPVITILTAAIGSFITAWGMDWYDQLPLPAFTPSGSLIGTVWTVLFILATIAALVVWNNPDMGDRKTTVAFAFIINAVLNVSWSLVFFGLHLIGPAIIEAVLLGISVLFLILLVAPVSKFAAWLLAPYFVWVSFATFLTYSIWTINK